MSHYRQYPEYRDSGVEWIGKVPEQWNVKRLRYVAAFMNSNVDKKAYDGQENVYLCNYTDVYYNEFINDRLSFMAATASKDELDRFSLKKGDVLITKDSEAPSDIGIPALVTENLPGVVCGYHLALIRSSDLTTARILHRVLQSHPAKAHFFVEAPGITRYGLSRDAIGDLRVCLPSPEHRSMIADWIDRETARIDALIAKKTQFIELLKEKRQILITHAVTKGLNPKVKMKDSGVDWIGEIPEHWQIKKLRYLLEEPLQYGANESGDASIEDGPRYVRITDLNEAGELRNESIKRLSPDVAEPYMLRDGDILFARSGATVGKTYCYKSEHGPACFAGYLIRARVDRRKVNPDFLILAVRSHYYWAYILKTAIQATIENVGAERYSDFPIVIPQREEQEAIIVAVSGILNRIDLLTNKTQRSVDLLKERRSALITAAVTGQIDFRESI